MASNSALVIFVVLCFLPAIIQGKAVEREIISERQCQQIGSTNNLAQALQPLIQNEVNPLLNTINQIITCLPQTVQGLVQGLLGILTNIIRQLMGSAVSGTNGVNNLPTAIQNLLATIGANGQVPACTQPLNLNNIQQALTPLIQNQIAPLINGVTKIVGCIPATLQGLVGGLGQLLSGVLQGILSVVTGVLGIFGGGTSNTANTAQLLTLIQSILSQLPGGSLLSDNQLRALIQGILIQLPTSGSLSTIQLSQLTNTILSIIRAGSATPAPIPSSALNYAQLQSLLTIALATQPTNSDLLDLNNTVATLIRALGPTAVAPSSFTQRVVNALAASRSGGSPIPNLNPNIATATLTANLTAIIQDLVNQANAGGNRDTIKASLQALTPLLLPIIQGTGNDVNNLKFAITSLLSALSTPVPNGDLVNALRTLQG